MKDAGYQYVVIDDCWQVSRDAEGNIVPDAKRFPGGMKALADYIHSKGLKFGIYSDAGTGTCQNRPGGRGYEFQDCAPVRGLGRRLSEVRLVQHHDAELGSHPIPSCATLWPSPGARSFSASANGDRRNHGSGPRMSAISGGRPATFRISGTSR